MAFYERRLSPFDQMKIENLSFFPHIHGHVELIYVCDGQITLTIGEQAKRLNPGDLAIVFPNTVHSYSTDQSERSLAHLLIFDTELAPDFAASFARYQPTVPFLRATKVHPDIPRALEAICDAPTSPLRHGYLLIIIGRALLPMELKKRQAPPNDDLLHRLLTYLDAHFREDITLESLGDKLNASRYKISRCFSHQIGCNFNSYLNAMRTSCAAGLLRRGDLSVADAGYEAGFDSLSTFYRAFKQSRGISPKAYRDQFSGESVAIED